MICGEISRRRSPGAAEGEGELQFIARECYTLDAGVPAFADMLAVRLPAKWEDAQDAMEKIGALADSNPGALAINVQLTYKGSEIEIEMPGRAAPSPEFFAARDAMPLRGYSFKVKKAIFLSQPERRRHYGG